MPGYRASTRSHRISLREYDGSDNWVDIREGRSSAAARRYATAGMHVTGFDVASNVVYIGANGIDLAAKRNILFQQSIIGWSLCENDGDEQAMAFGPGIYDQLDDDVATWLEQQIEAYYNTRRLTEEQLGNSTASSTAPSQAAVTSP